MAHLLHYESSHSFVGFHLVGMYVYYEYIYHYVILLGNHLVLSITPQLAEFHHCTGTNLCYLMVFNEVLLVNSLAMNVHTPSQLLGCSSNSD